MMHMRRLAWDKGMILNMCKSRLLTTLAEVLVQQMEGMGRLLRLLGISRTR